MAERVLYRAHGSPLHWDEREREGSKQQATISAVCQVLGFRSGTVEVFFFVRYGATSLDKSV
jgi:hypothetical protein